MVAEEVILIFLQNINFQYVGFTMLSYAFVPGSLLLHWMLHSQVAECIYAY